MLKNHFDWDPRFTTVTDHKISLNDLGLEGAQEGEEGGEGGGGRVRRMSADGGPRDQINGSPLELRPATMSARVRL